MRWLLLFPLTACVQFVLVDAACDGGAVDAGPTCDEAPERRVRMRWTSDQSNLVNCLHEACAVATVPLSGAFACQLRARYVGEGCSWSDDGGTLDVDCSALCIAERRPACCRRRPSGVGQGCDWMPP